MNAHTFAFAPFAAAVSAAVVVPETVTPANLLETVRALNMLAVLTGAARKAAKAAPGTWSGVLVAAGVQSDTAAPAAIALLKLAGVESACLTAAKEACLTPAAFWQSHSLKNAFKARFSYGLNFSAQGFTLGKAAPAPAAAVADTATEKKENAPAAPSSFAYAPPAVADVVRLVLLYPAADIAAAIVAMANDKGQAFTLAMMAAAPAPAVLVHNAETGAREAAPANIAAAVAAAVAVAAPARRRRAGGKG